MAFEQYKYQNEYNKEHYARLSVQVAKEDKNMLEHHWKRKGYKSFNAYVNDLIRKDMQESKVADSFAVLGLKELDGKIVKGIVNPLGILDDVKKKGIVADSSLQSD